MRKGFCVVVVLTACGVWASPASAGLVHSALESMPGNDIAQVVPTVYPAPGVAVGCERSGYDYGFQGETLDRCGAGTPVAAAGCYDYSAHSGLVHYSTVNDSRCGAAVGTTTASAGCYRTVSAGGGGASYLRCDVGPITYEESDFFSCCVSSTTTTLTIAGTVLACTERTGFDPASYCDVTIPTVVGPPVTCRVDRSDPALTLASLQTCAGALLP
jgi:hypothetical protein